MRYKGLEDSFQIEVAKYLDLLGVLWCHVPNESKSKPQYRRKQAAKGLKSGVPDILVFETNKQYNGLAMELKANYNKPSEEQLEWIDKLTKRGWRAFWTNDLDIAINEINKYLNL